MNLLAGESKAMGNTEVPGLDWPDYARFDCWSCHHQPRARELAAGPGLFTASPGRPPIFGVAAEDRRAGDRPPGDQGRRPLSRLRNELGGPTGEAVLRKADAKPYGRKDPMGQGRPGLREVVRRADQPARPRPATTRTSPSSCSASSIYPKAQENRTSYYDAARHVAWTIKILVEDAGDKAPRPPGDRAPSSRSSTEGLKLQLPAGPRSTRSRTSSARPSRSSATTSRPQFRENLKELADLLPPGEEGEARRSIRPGLGV